MKTLLKVFLLAALILAAAGNTKASTPPSWLDVVGAYGADPTCTNDSGPAINNAIAAAASPGSVLFFQTGCYLINTQIVDINAVPGITYLGYGRVSFTAGSGLSGSIMQFGNDTHTVSGRRISNIVFQCGTEAGLGTGFPDGIHVDGLINSVFDDVEIRQCSSNALTTIGNNPNNANNVFEAGVVITRFTTGSGIGLGPGADNWTFKGTQFLGASNSIDGASSGIGLEIESSGVACIGCSMSRWRIGLAAGLQAPVNGLEIAGGTYSGSTTAQIRLGTAGTNQSAAKVHGVSIHGASIQGNQVIYAPNPYCVDIQQADGFSITGNSFSCSVVSVRALADATAPEFGGADDGLVGPNDLTNSAPYILRGKNISLIASACNTSASPASCGFTSAGTVALPSGASSLTINTTFITTSSRITVSEDMTLGPQYDLPVTCNTVGGRTYSVTSKTPGTSFTITASSAPIGNPACLTFHVEN